MLMDLDEDAEERCNLIDRPERQALHREMKEELFALWHPDEVRRTVPDCQYGLTLIERTRRRQGLL